jgi:hypothetical protein
LKLSEVRERLWWLVVNVVTGTCEACIPQVYTTTVHTDVTVTQISRAHYVVQVKREQIIVDTTFRNYLGT